MRAKLPAVSMSLILLFSVTGARAENPGLADAEKTAWRYMTALLHGDLEMSFSLMDPRALDRRKADIEKAYAFAKKQGKADEFKNRFANIDDLDSVLRLPAKQFFVLLVKKDWQQAAPEHINAMQEAVVNVIGSRRVDAQTATVVLEIITPKSISDAPQQEGLILTLYRGQWKVVEKAQ